MRKVLLFLILITGFHSLSVFGEAWKYYIPGNNIKDIATWGDSVWCVSSGSVVLWSKRNGTYIQYSKLNGFPTDSGNTIANVLIDRTGIPWFTYQNGGTICRFDGKSPVMYTSKDSDIPQSQFFSSFRDSRGNLWFGTVGDGVVRYDGTTWKTFRPPEFITGVRVMAQDRRGVLWLAANGLWSFDGSSWTKRSEEEGPGDATVSCIASDTSGAIWFGTVSGVFRFDGNDWENYSTSNGLVSNTVNIIVPDRQRGIWVGTNGGAAHFDGESWKSFREADGLISKKVTGIALAADGAVWFSHGPVNMGITVYDGKEVNWYTTYNTSIPTNAVSTVVSDSAGVVWCIIPGGVMSWDGKEWRQFGVADGLQSAKVSTITIDAFNRKWFLYAASEENGATCFDGRYWETYTGADGLRSNAVTSVAVQEKGILWFGNQEGVSRFDGTAWDNFPKNDRLLPSVILDIAEDITGVIWFATDKGLTRFDGNSWWTYTPEDGLPEGQVYKVQGAPDSTLWLVCDGTLVSFDGTVFHRYPIPVDPGLTAGFRYSITRIALDNKGVLWTSTPRRYPDMEGKPVYGGLWCFRDGRWQEGFNPSIGGNIYDILFDDAGTLWITIDGGLKNYDGVSLRDYHINGPTGNSFTNSACDNMNKVWFFSPSNAECFDGKSWRRITPEYRGPMGPQKIHFDMDNFAWYQTIEGITKFDGIFFSLFAPRENFPVQESIKDLIRDKNGVFWVTFFNANGLYHFDGKTWTEATETENVLNGTVTDLSVDHKGVIWIVTKKCIYWYDGLQWSSTPIEGTYSIIDFGNDNSAWFHASEGIIKFDGKDWTLIVKKETYPKSFGILGIDNDNHIWGRYLEGAARYDGAAWKTYAEKDGLANAQVEAMAVDKNNIKWFITPDGICSLDDRPGADSDSKPQPITLRGNYPNPFNAGTGIEFDLYSWSRVDLSIYNIMGQKVRSITPGKLESGRHTILWNGTDDRGKRVSSGPYFYRIKNEGRLESGHMMMIK